MYQANSTRYEKMPYKRAGKSGLLLPAISLGLWHNFGGVDRLENAKSMLFKAFDLGITHFDLANNYGPPAGSAESTFGQILKSDLAQYRDEMIISTKAGYRMWAGPYGDRGSKKQIIASLDQSLKRLNLEYVDIFYSHRLDRDTPLEETLGALAQIVKSGKALYLGISNYPPKETEIAISFFKDEKIPLVLHQPSYSMLDRHIEKGLTDVLLRDGLGSIVFSPLAQGLLSDKYLKGIPTDSRAARSVFLTPEQITTALLSVITKLNSIALDRGQTLSQMAIAWVLQNPAVTSVLVGTSKPEQIEENVKSLEKLDFSVAELQRIEDILKEVPADLDI